MNTKIVQLCFSSKVSFMIFICDSVGDTISKVFHPFCLYDSGNRRCLSKKIKNYFVCFTFLHMKNVRVSINEVWQVFALCSTPCPLLPLRKAYSGTQPILYPHTVILASQLDCVQHLPLHSRPIIRLAPAASDHREIYYSLSQIHRSIPPY